MYAPLLFMLNDDVGLSDIAAMFLKGGAGSFPLLFRQTLIATRIDIRMPHEILASGTAGLGFHLAQSGKEGLTREAVNLDDLGAGVLRRALEMPCPKLDIPPGRTIDDHGYPRSALT